jgi:hypothetical protein
VIVLGHHKLTRFTLPIDLSVIVCSHEGN